MNIGDLGLAIEGAALFITVLEFLRVGSKRQKIIKHKDHQDAGVAPAGVRYRHLGGLSGENIVRAPR